MATQAYSPAATFSHTGFLIHQTIVMFSAGRIWARPRGWLCKSAIRSFWLSSARYATRALRPYQAECIKQCVNTLKEGKKRRLAVSIATGGGKTFVFTKLIPRLVELPLPDPSNGEKRGNGVLILVHRKELADQAMQSIRSCKELEGCDVFLEMAKANVTREMLEAEGDKLFVVIASVPTLARSKERLMKFPKNTFRGIIVDECHHAVSDSYLQIFRWFNCLKEKKCSFNESPFLLGFSATLRRHDKKPLRQVFDEIVYEKSMVSLVDEGYLVDCDWKMVEAGFRLSSVEMGGDGDYKLDSLAKHVNTSETNVLALKTYKYFRQKRNIKSTLVFCCDVEHMQALAKLFALNEIKAEYVTGSTSLSDRAQTIEKFKNGQIEVLINCGVFTEGTDIPNIDSILLLRPTKSQPLLTQMVGRGLRLSQGKTKCLVVDFVDSEETGISIDNTLGGVTVKNPIGSLFGGGIHGNGSKDIPLNKQPDYVEFKSFEGFKELLQSWKADRVNSSKQIERQVYGTIMRSRDPWLQIRKDTWAMRISSSHYYKIDIDRKKQIAKLIYVSMVPKKIPTGGRFPRYVRIPLSKNIAQSDSIAELLKKFSEDIESDSLKKEAYEAANARRFIFGRSKITPKQHDFLLNAIKEIINPSRQCHVDVGKFCQVVDRELDKLSKFEASNLISGYTISRKKTLEIWVSKKILNTKKKRLDLMEAPPPPPPEDSWDRARM